jgi:hypothetical protein
VALIGRPHRRQLASSFYVDYQAGRRSSL